MADWRPMLNRREDGFPRIMGVVNVTPDSFHPESRRNDGAGAASAAAEMFAEGASWIDVGGESTRPGATPVSTSEELGRVIPAIERIRSELPDVGISVDTRRAEVARQSLDAGADMINDVSSLSDPAMVGVVIDYDCPICIMHMQGLPENMQEDPLYEDVVSEVRGHLSKASERLMDSGIDPSTIIVDPGIGFGKNLGHNLALLSAGTGVVPQNGMPLMWGVSRKSMFGDLLGRDSSDDRLSGSLGVAAMAPEKGVDIIRVDDVAEHSDLFAAMGALR